MTGICKFCGCTDRTPCVFDRAYKAEDGSIQIAQGTCAWLLEDVCDAPPCVLAAYLESRPAAESLMFALGLMGEAA